MSLWDVKQLQDEDIAKIIDRLRSQGSDDGFVEAKTAVGKLNKDVWNTISAFSNTNGGLILLGVDEARNFAPAKGFDANKIIDSLDNGLNGKESQVAPVPNWDFKRSTFEGEPVLVVGIAPMHEDVNKAQQMPCFVVNQGIKKGSYKRLDDKNKHLTSYEIYQLQNRHKTDQSDQQVVSRAELEDLDMDLVNSVIERMRILRSRLINGDNSIAGVLRKLSSINKQDKILFAGLLCFGKYPQQFYPQLFVDVSKHPGKQKSVDASVRFEHRRLCEGPLNAQVEDAIDATLAVLNTRYVERGRTVEQEPEIPEVVLREAITNAVMHRDYGPVAISEQVGVDIFSDRVEIRNPGGLWGDRTLDNLDDGRSVPRNLFIAKTLSFVPANDKATIAENQGSGIQRMQAAMRQHGLPQPKFRVEVGAFTVILYRHGLLNPEAQQWLEKLGLGEMSTTRPELAQVVLLARDQGPVTPASIRETLGIDSDEAREMLAELLNDGVLSVSGGNEESFELSAETLGLSPVQVRILKTLKPDIARNIHQIVDEIGYSASAVRYGLRGLIDSGAVHPTAPPTSRSRAYTLNPRHLR